MSKMQGFLMNSIKVRVKGGQKEQRSLHDELPHGCGNFCVPEGPGILA